MHYRPKLYQDEGKPLNHGKPWEANDVALLQNAFRAGISLVETANKLHRRVSACLIKLKTLNMLEERTELGYTIYCVSYDFASVLWKPDSPIYDELDEVPEKLLVGPTHSATVYDQVVEPVHGGYRLMLGDKPVYSPDSAVEKVDVIAKAFTKAAEGHADRIINAFAKAGAGFVVGSVPPGCALASGQLVTEAMLEKAGIQPVTVNIDNTGNGMYDLEGADLEAFLKRKPENTQNSWLRYRTNKPTQKEQPVNIDNLQIETKTFINGTDVESIDDDTLLTILQKSKAKQASLEAMTNDLAAFHAKESKAQTDKLEQIIKDRAEKRNKQAEKAGK